MARTTRAAVAARHAPKPAVVGLSAAIADLAMAAALAACAFAYERLVAGHADDRQSNQPHFVLLADALLHVRLWIDPSRAARLGDVTPYAGHFYVSFPPMPAILMLPFVARLGPAFNDALFTVALGAVNAGLAYLVVRRASLPGFAGAGLPLGRVQAAVAALVLAVGTVQLYAALAGTVWFTAHVVAVTFMLLYLLECFGRGRPVVAGLALAAAFLARTPTVLGLIFWLVLALRHGGGVPRLARSIGWCTLPLVLASGLLLWQNQVRFGSPTDFGYYKMRIAAQLRPDLATYGQFNAHFLRRNLDAFALTPPIVDPPTLRLWVQQAGGVVHAPAALATPASRSLVPFPITFDPWGTGIWAVSPALFAALRPPARRDVAVFLAAWLGAGAVAIPDLLYYNTGWYQYGYRFSLDFTPLLLVLMAYGLRPPVSRLWGVAFSVALVVSAGSNLLGARWFLHLPPY